MAGSPGKRPRPSYEDGKLRDPSIKQKMDPDFTREDFQKVVKKVVRKRPK